MYYKMGYSIVFAIITLLWSVFASSGSREWAPEPPTAWARETPFGAAKITALDVICGKEHMTVRAEFSAPFQGIISSKGTYGQDNCVYVKPYSGITHATFNVRYDQCGTKPDLQGKYYENTVVIQYGTDIIEAWDEAKRLRCEWFEAYEKPATFRPAIPVADLDVIEMNFQGDEIDCWMSIQEGKGPWAREVSRIVAVGQPMTIVIAINDFKNQFDMRVKSCFAHDGQKPAIHLTDEYGCVLRPKMLSPFKKIRDSKGKATLISYAQFLAFKFPDSMDVQIQCTVEVCRHGCADACQVEGPHQSNNPSLQVSAEIPHSIPNQESPQSYRPDDEPQPVFQDIGGGHQPQFDSENQNYNIDLKSGSADDQSQDQQVDDYQAMPSIQNFQINKKFESDSSHSEHTPEETEYKPVYKVPDIQNNNNNNNNDLNLKQKLKLPNLSDLKIPNLKPEDFDIANKLLLNHGLNKGNLDFNNLAASFVQGLQHKDLMSLIQNNNMKDLVSKFANRIEEQPIAEALQSTNDKNDSFLQNIHLPTEQTTNPYNIEPIQLTTKLFPNGFIADTEPALSEPIVRPQYNQLPFNIYNKDLQNLKLNNPYNKKISHNSVEKEVPLSPNVPQVSAPVAQVLDVPLQPGLPFHQVIPNEIFKHQMMNRQKPLVPNSHPMHLNFPKHNLPVGHPSHPHPHANAHPHAHPQAHPAHFQHPFPPMHPNNHQMMNGFINKRKGSEMPKDMANSQFPFGPRSLRIRRSANEIGLKKGFQVVTSVDLAFFPNITTDSAPIYSGRRDDIVYGVCLPVAQLATGLSCILWLIVVAFSSCAFMIYKLDKYKKSTLSNN